MSQLQVDIDLINKYNVAGPRYTSYPPANRFTNEVGWPQLADEIIASQVREIHTMRLLLQDIDRNGRRGDAPLAPRPAVVTPEMEVESREAVK